MPVGRWDIIRELRRECRKAGHYLSIALSKPLQCFDEEKMQSNIWAIVIQQKIKVKDELYPKQNLSDTWSNKWSELVVIGRKLFFDQDNSDDQYQRQLVLVS